MRPNLISNNSASQASDTRDNISDNEITMEQQQSSTLTVRSRTPSLNPSHSDDSMNSNMNYMYSAHKNMVFGYIVHIVLFYLS